MGSFFDDFTFNKSRTQSVRSQGAYRIELKRDDPGQLGDERGVVTVYRNGIVILKYSGALEKAEGYAQGVLDAAAHRVAEEDPESTLSG